MENIIDKNKSNTEINIINMSYEEAIKRIEEINLLLENEQTPIDILANLYEEAQKLLTYCSEKLSDIEQKIYIVTKENLTLYTNDR